METIQADVAIIGAGGAGLRAAPPAGNYAREETRRL